MGLILLAILLILIFMFINYKTQRDFISPTFLLLASFLMAFVLIALNFENWMIEINSVFVLIVFCAILAFVSASISLRVKKGVLLINTEKKHYYNSRRRPSKYKKVIDKYPTYLMIAISTILFVVFTFILIKEVGIGSGLTDTYRRIYESKFATEGGHFAFHQVEKLLIAIGYINYFHLMNILFFAKEKKLKQSLLTLIPIFLSLLCAVVSTDRNIILRFFIYFLVLWILYYQRGPRRKLKKSNQIILFSTFFILIIMVLSFYALGKMKQYTSNLERMVGIYAGSGLYNFNLYVKNFNGEYTFGAATFKALINVLTVFGFDGSGLPQEPGFITYRSLNDYVYSSNIYSGLQPFYQDFGVFGVILFVALMGLFFEFIYQKTYRYNYGVVWIGYSAFIYPLIFISIADQFYSRLHFGLVYEIFYLFLLFYLTYGRAYKKYRIELRKKKKLEQYRMKKMTQGELV